jgi:hypothetical protein
MGTMGTIQIAKLGHELKNRQGQELNKKTPQILNEGKKENVCKLCLRTAMDKIRCSSNETDTEDFYYKPAGPKQLHHYEKYNNTSTKRHGTFI